MLSRRRTGALAYAHTCASFLSLTLTFKTVRIGSIFRGLSNSVCVCSFQRAQTSANFTPQSLASIGWDLLFPLCIPRHSCGRVHAVIILVTGHGETNKHGSSFSNCRTLKRVEIIPTQRLTSRNNSRFLCFILSSTIYVLTARLL